MRCDVKRWQYTETNYTLYPDSLNELGADGWELVAVVAEPATRHLEAAIVAYFKRELVPQTIGGTE